MENEVVRDVKLPVLGLGTAQITGDECINTVDQALNSGYRHIDTAQLYGNEREIGKAIENSRINRDKIFLVTKIKRRNLGKDKLCQSFINSLEKLRTNYVDLLLIHAPSRKVPIKESIHEMNKLYDKDKINHIGVSNFSVEQTKKAIDASSTPIITNQVKYHPMYGQEKLLKFCLKEDICLTAYSPLARGKVHGNQTLKKIGSRYNKNEFQIALRWLIQQENVVAIPKASSRKHLEENIDIFDFELNTEEMKKIFGIHGGIKTKILSLLSKLN